MKINQNIILGASLIFSISSQARIDRVYQLKNPSPMGSNFGINIDSNANGVCESLGFESAVAGSIKGSLVTPGYKSIFINEQGQITHVRSGQTISSINCFKKSYKEYYERVSDINLLQRNITYPGSQSRFENSNETAKGFCKLFGYDKLIMGSAEQIQYTQYDNLIILDKDGNIKGTKKNTALDSISCLKIEAVEFNTFDNIGTTATSAEIKPPKEPTYNEPIPRRRLQRYNRNNRIQNGILAEGIYKNVKGYVGYSRYHKLTKIGRFSYILRYGSTMETKYGITRIQCNRRKMTCVSSGGAKYKVFDSGTYERVTSDHRIQILYEKI